MASIADMARDYGSVETWRPSNPLYEMLATIAAGMRGVEESIGRGRGGKQVSSNPMKLAWGDLPEAIDRLAYQQQLKPGHYLDLAGAVPFAGKAVGMAGKGAQQFTKHVDFGELTPRISGGPMAQVGAISIKGDVKPKLRKLEDEFPSREAAAAAAATPPPAKAKLAPMPEMAERYPQTVHPTSGFDEKKAADNKYPWYPQKQLGDEARQVEAIRKEAQAEIDAKDAAYKPYFDIKKRSDVDESFYPRTHGNTLEDAMPKTYDTTDKYYQQYHTPEAKDRLREAIKEGSKFPDAENFYAMKQLEDKFIEYLGPEEGRKMFKKRVADSLAATTGGADPEANLLTSAYANFMENSGKKFPRNLDDSAASYDLPYPIGGRYVGGNIDKADDVLMKGQALTAEVEPKRYNFSGNFTGRKGNSTIDEQMMTAIDPSLKAPAHGSYGIAEDLVNEIGKEFGRDPMNVQDVAWLGLKRAKAKTPEELEKLTGKPMIEEINRMLHRTTRVGGESQEKALERYIRANGAMYGMAGVSPLALKMLLEQEDEGTRP